MRLCKLSSFSIKRCEDAPDSGVCEYWMGGTSKKLSCFSDIAGTTFYNDDLCFDFTGLADLMESVKDF